MCKEKRITKPKHKVFTPCITVYFVSVVVDCGPLHDPDNGMVDTSRGTTYNSRATYACDSGYNLNGTDSRICQSDGMWSATEPVCNRKQGLK